MPVTSAQPATPTPAAPTSRGPLIDGFPHVPNYPESEAVWTLFQPSSMIERFGFKPVEVSLKRWKIAPTKVLGNKWLDLGYEKKDLVCTDIPAKLQAPTVIVKIERVIEVNEPLITIETCWHCHTKGTTCSLAGTQVLTGSGAIIKPVASITPSTSTTPLGQNKVLLNTRESMNGSKRPRDSGSPAETKDGSKKHRASTAETLDNAVEADESYTEFEQKLDGQISALVETFKSRPLGLISRSQLSDLQQQLNASRRELKNAAKGRKLIDGELVKARKAKDVAQHELMSSQTETRLAKDRLEEFRTRAVEFVRSKELDDGVTTEEAELEALSDLELWERVISE